MLGSTHPHRLMACVIFLSAIGTLLVPSRKGPQSFPVFVDTTFRAVPSPGTRCSIPRPQFLATVALSPGTLVESVMPGRRIHLPIVGAVLAFPFVGIAHEILLMLLLLIFLLALPPHLL